MNQYTVTYCKDQPDWNKIPVLEMTNAYRQTPAEVRAFAQLAYTDEALLVHLRGEVPEIIADETGPVGMPCRDSCLEFFFCPVPGDARYINIEFNFNGCMYMGMGSCIQDLIRLLPNQADNPLDPDIRKTQTGWEIYYSIPYAFIRRLFPAFTAEPGMTIRANCYACADNAKPRQLKSWNLVQADPFTFHHSQSFGFMIFSNQ